MSKTNTSPSKHKLPKYCFYRGNMIWFTYPQPDGDWGSRSTGFRRGQEPQADKLVKRMHQKLKELKGETGLLTLRMYVEQWLKDREARGAGTVRDDRNRLRRYVLPVLGGLPLDDVRPFQIRDLVRALKAGPEVTAQETEGTLAAIHTALYAGVEKPRKLAPRSIIHIYRLLHTVYESARFEEKVSDNPCVLERGELPKKSDKDAEWRSNATFTVREVERLISDPLVPVERRVQYALKAIAGMRHGEVAALCWRHIDYSYEPLARINIVQAYDSHKRRIKSTKSDETRAVPMHPTLAKIIASWKLEHWERIYGRKPSDDDFVVPARTMQPVKAGEAGRAMKDDMLALEMRVMAGKSRKRGGHDLRSWYKTRCIEDEADSIVIRRTTHAPPKDVDGGYERFSWSTICREVSKLRVSIIDGKVLPLLTSTLQAEVSAAARWRNVATPTGFEAVSEPPNQLDDRESSSENARSSDHERALADAVAASAPNSARQPRYVPKLSAFTARSILAAIQAGDAPRAMRLVSENAILPKTPPAEPTDDLAEARGKRAAKGTK